MLILIYLVLSVNSDNRLVCGDFDNVKAVNSSELRFLGHSRTGHTGKLRIKAEEVLEGYCCKSLALVLYLYSLFCFYCLMKTLVEAASEHKTACKLVDDYDFSVLYNVLYIKVHTAVCLDCLINVVEDCKVIRIHKVFNAEVLFSLLDACGKEGCCLCLFVDNIVAVVVVLFFLSVNLNNLDSLH